MTPGADDKEERFAGSCTVCGETVRGRPYLALGLFGVFTEQGDGLHFEPEEEPEDVATWKDVAVVRAVHVDCAQLYVEMTLSNVAHLRRSAAQDGDR